MLDDSIHLQSAEQANLRSKRVDKLFPRAPWDKGLEWGATAKAFFLGSENVLKLC